MIFDGFWVVFGVGLFAGFRVWVWALDLGRGVLVIEIGFWCNVLRVWVAVICNFGWDWFGFGDLVGF